MKKSDYIVLFLLIAALLQLMVSMSAWAEEDTILRLDQDHDGLITIKEAVADPTILAFFGKLDTDGDGKLSKQELKKLEQVSRKPKQALKT